MIGFMIILIFGWIGFVHFMDEKSWWAIPVLLGWLGASLAWLFLTEVKKCPNCKKKCRTTGVGGSDYKQWHCKTCGKNFWTTVFLQDYE